LKKYILQLGNESFVYGISSIVSKFLSFFIIPFYARMFSTAEYGEIALLNSIFFFLAVIVTCGLESAVYRWFFDDEDSDKRLKIFGLWFKSQLVFTAVISILLIGFSTVFASHFFSSANSQYFLWIISANLFLNLVPQVVLAWLRLNRLPWPTVYFSMLTALLSIAFSFLFVIVLEWGVIGFFAGQAVGLLLATIFGIVKYAKLFKWIKLDFSILKPMLKYGLNILPATLTASTVILVTNFIIQTNISQSDLGLYQMGNNLAMLILLVVSAFGQAWPPFSFSIMGKENFLRIYVQVLDIYIILLSVIALFIGVFAHEILLILTTEKFVDGAWVAGILAYAYFISSLSVIAITGLSILKDVRMYSPIVMVSAILTVLLQLLFVRYGKEAVALSILIGQSIIPVLLFIFAQRKYYIPYNLLKNAGVLALSVLCFISARMIPVHDFWILFLIKGLIILGFIIFIVMISFKQVRLLWKKNKLFEGNSV